MSLPVDPPAAPLGPPPSDEAILALNAIAEATDPLQVLADLVNVTGEAVDLASRPDVPIPGDSERLRIHLSDQDEQLLVAELCDLLDEYDLAMRERLDRENEIRDAYQQRFDSGSAGAHPSSAQMTSEMLFSMVDQANARITTNMMAVDPLIKVDAVTTEQGSWAEAEGIALDAQKFVNAYMMEELGFRYLLPVALHRCAKVGTAVFYMTWEDQKEVRYVWDKDSDKPQRVTQRIGRVKVDLIDNADVKVWPPTITDWQSGYIFVGHEATFTPAEWRSVAGRYRIPREEADAILQEPDTNLREGEPERAGIQTMMLKERAQVRPVRVTELWCHMTLPGRDEPDKFQVVLHRGRRRLLWVGFNGFHTQRHPYFPLRYKLTDSNCWGTGVGDEVLCMHCADSALWNLELDNLYSGCYWAILRKAGSIYDTQTGGPRPGMEIAVDDVDKDFKPIKLGGDAPEIGMTRLQNQNRAAGASGLSAVMFGMGDPTMKSGAGTGSTLALIEQGNKKLALIDQYLRTDFSALPEQVLELVTQFGQAGVFYRVVDEASGDRLRRLLYRPPRGDIRSMLRFRAQAPSANTTDEARKQAYLMIWSFALQHIQVIERYVVSVLETENPAAITRWQKTVISYINLIARRVVELLQMPGVVETVPDLPEPTGGDEQINFLMGQVGELQQALQEAQSMLQQLSQQGAAMMSPQGLEPGALAPGPEQGDVVAPS